MAAAPDHLVHAFPDNTVAAQEQQKFIGNVEAVKEAPHAAVGDIDNEAAARWNSGSAPFPRPPPQSRRLLSVSEDDHHSGRLFRWRPTGVLRRLIKKCNFLHQLGNW
jgi:hypothetical protein